MKGRGKKRGEEVNNNNNSFNHDEPTEIVVTTGTSNSINGDQDGNTGASSSANNNGSADFDMETPEVADGSFEVEAIRRRRVHKGEVQYMVKWRGRPEITNKWEPLKNLGASMDLVDAFEERLRSKSRTPIKEKRKNNELVDAVPGCNLGNGLGCRNNFEDSGEKFPITKIIKKISQSPSVTNDDVDVIFLAVSWHVKHGILLIFCKYYCRVFYLFLPSKSRRQIVFLN
ncbi:Chromo domain [Dillenia turbinata]|uniref:Chromo domain n=1 Tax=Dillenia turbinata TaxID=194707 RepID=A0AAN8UJM9_9MAGN